MLFLNFNFQSNTITCSEQRVGEVEEGSRESREDVGSSGVCADDVAAECVRDWPVGRARSQPGSCGCWTPRGSWRCRSSWRSCGGWMRGRRRSYSQRSDPPGAWRMEAGVGVCAMCCPLTRNNTNSKEVRRDRGQDVSLSWIFTTNIKKINKSLKT